MTTRRTNALGRATQERILSLISEPKTADQIAASLCMHHDVIRDHLRRLQIQQRIKPAGFDVCPQCGNGKAMLWGLVE